MEGFGWDDLRKIVPGCEQMATVPNGVEILPKISVAWVVQTDGRAMTYSEREREFRANVCI